MSDLILHSDSHHRFLLGSQTDDLEAAVSYKLGDGDDFPCWVKRPNCEEEKGQHSQNSAHKRWKSLAPSKLATPVASSTCCLLWADCMPTSLFAAVPYEILPFANVLRFVRGLESRRGMCLYKTVPWCLQGIDSVAMYRNQNSWMLKIREKIT